ncbi:MAG: integration host factor subunit beta [Sterolibacteriaceae bacterium]|uniref:Integration host factor subunit beta n=1 Tax=Candidatus Methylophosphatis roskildensis TaxID=2899263 RepID=A0A9D7E2N3_9PROT|nr:integration host factor subunit beta [Candidatus Methylophosphatis roskildensis]MBK7237562.1 integration host factor subunit beta [Sterolibacteriaceae bacterium]
MTRSELISRIARRFPELKLVDAEASVSEILGAITAALTAGNRIEIRDFGSFSLSERRSRAGRNPKTGDAVSVPQKVLPRFKPGKLLRAIVKRAFLGSAAL